VLFGDLLHVGHAKHVDVRHQQTAVGDVAFDPLEDERLDRQVQLEEAVLAAAGQRVRPPDRVKAVSYPGGFRTVADQSGQWTERVRRRCDLDGLQRLDLGMSFEFKSWISAWGVCHRSSF
jgi:hypothetical protein